MTKKTYNIHQILEFANRAELTLEEFEMSYEEEFEDLSKRGIKVISDEPYGLAIGPHVRRAQIGPGVFTIGIYPEVKLPKTDPETPSKTVGMTLAYTDEDGKQHKTRVHYNQQIPKDPKAE